MTDRERDAWLAEHVMGWRWYDHGTSDVERRSLLLPGQVAGVLRGPHGLHWVPGFSTDPVAMVSLIDAMRAKGFHVSMRSDERVGAGCLTKFWQTNRSRHPNDSTGKTWMAAVAAAAEAATRAKSE